MKKKVSGMKQSKIKLEGYAEIEWRSKTVKMSKQIIELSNLDKIINKKVVDFINKYMREPRYIKMPLWIKDALIKTMSELNIKIDYIEEVFRYRNMRVCETITINKPEEIEVF